MKCFLRLLAVACFASPLYQARADAPAPIPVTIDSRFQEAPRIEAFRANTRTYRVSFKDGGAASDLTNTVPFMHWGTNALAAGVSTSTWAFVGATTSGIVDFTFDAGALNYTPGRYVYEAGVLAGSNPKTYRKGVIQILPSMIGSGAASITWTTNVDWSAISWRNLPDYKTGAQVSNIVAGIVATNTPTLVESDPIAVEWFSTNNYLRSDENGYVTFMGAGTPDRILFRNYTGLDPMRGIVWNTANGTWELVQGGTNTLRLSNTPAHPNLNNDIFEMGFRYLRWGGETRSNWPASPPTASSWRNPEWFNLVWANSPTSCPDSTTYRTNLDQVIERQGYNMVKYDRVAQISDQHEFFELDFSVAPAERASVSSNGYMTHIADGVVTAAVTATSFGRTNVLVMRTEGMAIDRYWDGAEASLRAAIISNVTAGVGTTGATMRTFSTYETNGTAFVRSTNLWIRPAPECVAAWNSRVQPWHGGGVLITPRHAITAGHASFRPQVGDTVKWVDATNGIWAATVDAEVRVAADIAMIRLDAEIPVPVAKLIADPAGSLPTGIREIPLACGEVHFGGHEFQLVVGGSEGWNERGYTGISWWKAAEKPAWRALFRHYPVSGDSSQPVLFSTGTDFVLLFCLYYPTSGPSVHSYLEEIQAAIAAWGDPDTLSYLDVTPYTEF